MNPVWVVNIHVVSRHRLESVKNEEVLHRVMAEWNILHTVRRSKANWIGRNSRMNCVLRHIIGGKIPGKVEGTGRRGRRRKQLVDD